jgi:uncharacterized membrane protein (DUF373 family)
MRKLISETKQLWPNLGLYERFEQVIALVLTLLISIVIVVSTWNLLRTIFAMIANNLLEPSKPEVVQAIFGMALIVLIALEFNHSLLGVVERGRSIIQVRTVVLIALLAVLRKFIVIEVGDADAFLLIALAIAALSLGLVFWALRAQDQATETPSTPAVETGADSAIERRTD